jgi:hypothetical protein
MPQFMAHKLAQSSKSVGIISFSRGFKVTSQAPTQPDTNQISTAKRALAVTIQLPTKQNFCLPSLMNKLIVAPFWWGFRPEKKIYYYVFSNEVSTKDGDMNYLGMGLEETDNIINVLVNNVRANEATIEM